MKNRKGDWIQTYSGNQFFPLDARADEIYIQDIAHVLSMLCRFGGHCERFYSVAEHSCHMSDRAPQKYKLEALLHDATEAYLVDVPRPIKRELPDYKEIELGLVRVISERFNLPEVMSTEVKMLDNLILFDEMDQNMKTPPKEWVGATTMRLDVQLQYWSPETSKQEFMQRFIDLT